jgi:acetyltransferase-like isoleucine patch superfamily enzyme
MISFIRWKFKALFYHSKRIGRILFFFLCPYFVFIKETKDTQTPITFKIWFFQKILGFNRKVYWPTHYSSTIRNFRNIYAGIETCPGYETGCYIQAVNPIFIGDYTQIANHVGIISANHNPYDLRTHVEGKPVKIGKYCWLGMSSIILPEVELGDFTIVGAGSVVTRSFPEGYCVIAGNPAKIIKNLEKEKCIQHQSKHEYYGYYKKGPEFEKYRSKNLKV